MLAMLLVAWAAWTFVDHVPRSARQRFALIAIAVPVAALGIANTVSAARTSTPLRRESTLLTKLMPPVIRALPPRRGVVIAETTPNAWPYVAGVVLWLERSGVPVRVPDTPDAEQAYGYARVYHGGVVRARVIVADGADYDELVGDPREHLLAYQGTLSPAERRAVLTQRAAILDRFRAGLLTGKELFTRLDELNRRLGYADAVFIRS